MRPNHQTLIIVISGIFAAFLGWASHWVKNYVIDLSSKNMFGFGFAALLYIVFPVVFFFLGLVFAGALISINSSRAAVLISLLFSLISSLIYIKHLLATYFGFEYVHRTYLKTDVFQICANFIIFPLLGFLIWNVKKRFENSYVS